MELMLSMKVDNKKTIKMKGTVKFFNDKKGYGFVVSDDGNEYFVHISGLKGMDTLEEGATIAFDLKDGERGQSAVNVELIEELQ